VLGLLREWITFSSAPVGWHLASPGLAKSCQPQQWPGVE
jgi:hypothetical protein